MGESPASEEQVALFTRSLGRDQASPLTTDETDAARHIIAALGQDTDVTLLAADYAREFHIALPALANELEHPHEATLRMTRQPLIGGELVAATAIRRGQVQQDRDDPTEAERCFRWASERFHALGLQEWQALALVLLGRIAQMHERLEEAEECYEQALAVDRTVGNRQDEGVDLGLLAQVAWLSGRLDDAVRLAHQALALHQQVHDWRNAGSTLKTLGDVARERGQGWRARVYFVRATLAEHGLM